MCVCECGGGSRVQPYLSVWDNYNYTGSAISKQICRFAPHVLTRCAQDVAYPNRFYALYWHHRHRGILPSTYSIELFYTCLLFLFSTVWSFQSLQGNRDVIIALTIKAYVETSPFSLMFLRPLNLYRCSSYPVPPVHMKAAAFGLAPHTHTEPGHKSFKHSLFSTFLLRTMDLNIYSHYM